MQTEFTWSILLLFFIVIYISIVLSYDFLVDTPPSSSPLTPFLETYTNKNKENEKEITNQISEIVNSRTPLTKPELKEKLENVFEYIRNIDSKNSCISISNSQLKLLKEQCPTDSSCNKIFDNPSLFCSSKVKEAVDKSLFDLVEKPIMDQFMYLYSKSQRRYEDDNLLIDGLGEFHYNLKTANQPGSYYFFKGDSIIYLKKTAKVEVFLVGGGGSGNHSAIEQDGIGGAGGGGGGVGIGQLTFKKNSIYQIIVGKGGKVSENIEKLKLNREKLKSITNNQLKSVYDNKEVFKFGGISVNGGDSKIFNKTDPNEMNEVAYGGGGGGTTSDNYLDGMNSVNSGEMFLLSGNYGGSGGGGICNKGKNGTGGTALTGNGTLQYLGNKGGTSNTSYNAGGGGGGAKSVGGNATEKGPGNGGDGYDYLGRSYGGGGGGGVGIDKNSKEIGKNGLGAKFCGGNGGEKMGDNGQDAVPFSGSGGGGAAANGQRGGDGSDGTVILIFSM